MRIAQVQFVSWDKVYNFDPVDLTIEEKDKVIVKTEIGTEIGEVVGFTEIEKSGEKKEDSENKKETEIKPIIRLATAQDLGKTISLSEKKKALDLAKQMKDRHNLPMKFIDVHFSFDGSRITFAFIADGRVDFRELAKDLTRNFSRTIRLQQIGIRDEAKIMGDVGHCGRGLCCKGHLNELASITSDMAEQQECSHRGSERISGVCGRLMCCLAYEQKGYEDSKKKLPVLGTKVNVDGKRGVVVGHHTIKQAVSVEFPGENGSNSTVVEIDLNRNKKKKDK